MQKRILSLLLALAMVLTLLPVSAAAADLPEAQGDVITITEAGEYTIDSTIGGRVVVDASGQDVVLNVTDTVAVDELAVKVPFITNKAGNVTIQGNGTLSRSDQDKAHYIVLNHDTMEIKGDVTITSGVNSSTVNNFGTMTISGGTIQTEAFIALKNDAEETTEKLAGQESRVGTMTITGGTIKNKGTSGTSFLNWGTATISGGTIDSANVAVATYASPGSENASTLIEDGSTFIGVVESYKKPSQTVSDISTLAWPKVTITGGSFTRTHSSVAYPRNVQVIQTNVEGQSPSRVEGTALDIAAFSISGGTFTCPAYSGYISEDVVAVKVHKGQPTNNQAGDAPQYTYLDSEAFATEFGTVQTAGATDLYTPEVVAGLLAKQGAGQAPTWNQVTVNLESVTDNSPSAAEQVATYTVDAGQIVKLPAADGVTYETEKVLYGWKSSDETLYNDYYAVDAATGNGNTITLTAQWADVDDIAATVTVDGKVSAPMSLADAIAAANAAESGKTVKVTLEQDIEIESSERVDGFQARAVASPYEMYRDMTLDFGAHTVKVNAGGATAENQVYVGFWVAHGAEVEFTADGENGGIVVEAAANKFYDPYGAIYANTGSTVKLNGMNISAKNRPAVVGSAASIEVKDSTIKHELEGNSSTISPTGAILMLNVVENKPENAQSLTIENSTISHKGTAAAVEVNYQTTAPVNVSISNSTITQKSLNDATTSGEGTALMIMGPGKVTITDGEDGTTVITGVEAAVAATKASISISGENTTLKATGAHAAFHGTEPNKLYPTGAALYVEPCETGMEITIEDAKLESDQGAAVSVPSPNANSQNLTVEIKSGEFIGADKDGETPIDVIEVKDAETDETVTVSGGKFSKPVDPNLLADDLAVLVDSTDQHTPYEYGDAETLLDDPANENKNIYDPTEVPEDPEVEPDKYALTYSAGDAAAKGVTVNADYATAQTPVGKLFKLPAHTDVFENIPATGVTFKGWLCDQDHEDCDAESEKYHDKDEIFTMPGAAVTLTAAWDIQAVEQTVTLKFDPGTEGWVAESEWATTDSYAAEIVDDGGYPAAVITKLPGASDVNAREGYLLTGWVYHDSENGEGLDMVFTESELQAALEKGTQYLFEPMSVVAGTTYTLTPQWTQAIEVTVNFDLDADNADWVGDDPSGTVVALYDEDDGYTAQVKLPNADEVTRSGYTLTGWIKDGTTHKLIEGHDKYVTLEDLNADDVITFTADWEATVLAVTVNFVTDEAHPFKDGFETKVICPADPDDENYVTIEFPNPDEAGAATLHGWTIEGVTGIEALEGIEDGMELVYDESLNAGVDGVYVLEFPITESATLTFTAVWKTINVTLTNGNATVTVDGLAKGDKVDLTQFVKDMHVDSQVVKGWTDVEDGTEVKYTTEYEVTDDENDVTLYPVYVDGVTVKLDTDRGVPAEDVELLVDVDVNNGETYTLPAEGKVTLEGHKLLGWTCDNEDCEICNPAEEEESEDAETEPTVTYHQPGETVTLPDAPATVTFKAVWEKTSGSSTEPPVVIVPDDENNGGNTDSFFVDVPETAYYYNAVAWGAKLGIVAGKTETTFAPNDPTTRAQFVTFLWRAAGSPAPKSAENPFTDVKAGAYYEDAVLWAVENGIVAGTSKTTFSPSATCTRAQAVTFLWRYNGEKEPDDSESFTDVASSAYYADAVAWASENNIAAGTGNDKFSPDAKCVRAQAVTFLYRNLAK